MVDMRTKYVLAGALIAMFVVPGTAGQLITRGVLSSALLPAPLGSATAGLFHDPNAEPTLTIRLPTRFHALDVGTHPVDSFRG